MLQYFLTSGTTGQPKVVAHSQVSLRSAALRCVKHFDLSANDTWLLCLSTAHVAGAMVLERARVCGARVIWISKWSVGECLQNIGRVQCVSLVPAQVFDLVHARAQAPQSLRYVFVGGDRLAPSLWDQALNLGWPIVATYGMTETAGMVATVHREGFLEPLQGVALSVHLERLCVEADGSRILTDDLATQIDGKIYIRGRAKDLGKVLGEWVSLDRLRRIWAELEIDSGLQVPSQFDFVSDARKGLCVRLTLLSPHPEFLESFNQRVRSFERVSEILIVDRFNTKALQLTTWLPNGIQ